MKTMNNDIVENTGNAIPRERVDLSGMNAGLYFIQVENNKGLFVTGKFIKQ